MTHLKKETANIWEYKVGNNANIVNFVGENLEQGCILL